MAFKLIGKKIRLSQLFLLCLSLLNGNDLLEKLRLIEKRLLKIKDPMLLEKDI